MCQTWPDFWDHKPGNTLEMNVHSKICLSEVTCHDLSGFGFLSLSTLSSQFNHYHVHIIWSPFPDTLKYMGPTTDFSLNVFVLAVGFKMESLDIICFSVQIFLSKLLTWHKTAIRNEIFFLCGLVWLPVCSEFEQQNDKRSIWNLNVQTLFGRSFYVS